MSENCCPEKEALRKLFCGGLDRNTTDETFRGHFEQFGNIVDLVIIRDKHTQASKGFGFVTYDSSEGVLEALNARPHNIDGRTVEIKRAIPRDENTETAHQRTKKLFVGGLPGHCTDEDIKTYFEENYEGKGEILKVDLIRNKDTNELRGFGFIEVSSEDFTDLIIITDPKPVIAGKKIEVKKCEDRGSGGGGGRGGSRGGGRGGSRGRGGYGGDRGGGQSGGYWSGGMQNSNPVGGYGGYQGGVYGGNDYGAGYGTGYQGAASYGGGYGGYGAGYDQSAGGYGQQAYGGRGGAGGAGGRGASRYRPY